MVIKEVLYYLYFLCSQLSLILTTLDESAVLMMGALVSNIFLDPALMLKSVSTWLKC